MKISKELQSSYTPRNVNVINCCVSRFVAYHTNVLSVHEQITAIMEADDVFISRKFNQSYRIIRAPQESFNLIAQRF